MFRLQLESRFVGQDGLERLVQFPDNCGIVANMRIVVQTDQFVKFVDGPNGLL